MDEEGLYTISVAARLVQLQEYRIRWLESHGLLRPRRTPGQTRLYSNAEIELLLEIAELLRQKVNISGIRIILRLKGREIE